MRCADENAALDAFCERVRTFDPDVLTGWNTIDFDLTRRCSGSRRACGIRSSSGATPARCGSARRKAISAAARRSIPGRLVLDGIDLLRGAFVRMDDYSLDAVAREVLGEGKAVAGDVRDRIGEILHNYAHDLPAFALYARTDARLAYQIVRELDLVPLAFARSALTGMTPDRVAASIASFDFLYLSELERREHRRADRALRRFARARRAAGRPRARARHGPARERLGVRLQEPVSEHHPHVQHRSARLRRRRRRPDDDLIETPGGAFRREPAILPRMLDELFPRREAAKRAGDDVASHAIKILMNSFYGVLGTPACRFFNPALANSITGHRPRACCCGRSAGSRRRGFRVLYGDTDSLFVRLGRGRSRLRRVTRGTRARGRAQRRARALHRASAGACRAGSSWSSRSST